MRIGCFYCCGPIILQQNSVSHDMNGTAGCCVQVERSAFRRCSDIREPEQPSVGRQRSIIWSLKRNQPSGLWVGRPEASPSPERTVRVCLFFLGRSTSLIALLIKDSNHRNHPSLSEAAESRGESSLLACFSRVS